MMASTSSKKKCRKYSQEYLKFGFVASPSNETRPMCLICERTFSNEAMKPSKMKDHIIRVHSDMINNDLDFYVELREIFCSRSNTLLTLFRQKMKAEMNQLFPMENVSEVEENVEHEDQPKMNDAGSKGFSTPNKRRKLEQRLCTVKKAVNDHMKSPMSQSEENEFDIFGLYVSTCLQKLPLPRAFRLQEKINSLIVEERISYASHTSPCSNGMTVRNHGHDNDYISTSQSSHDELATRNNLNFNDNSLLEGQLNVKTEAFEIECDPGIAL